MPNSPITIWAFEIPWWLVGCLVGRLVEFGLLAQGPYYDKIREEKVHQNKVIKKQVLKQRNKSGWRTHSDELNIMIKATRSWNMK